jgi:hypothetical protein
MNRILSQRSNIFFLNHHKYHSSTLKKQQTQADSAFNNKRERKFESNTTYNINSSLINFRLGKINNKIECLLSLKLTAQVLNAQFPGLHWIAQHKNNTWRAVNLQLFQKNINTDKKRSEIIERTHDLVTYLNENLSQFNAKEKAIIFKIFSIIKPFNHQLFKDRLAPLINLLSNLERDYFRDTVGECDVIDYLYYVQAFAFYRDSNLHFNAVTTDVAFQKIRSYITNLRQDQNTPKELEKGSEKTLEKAVEEDSEFGKILNDINACFGTDSNHTILNCINLIYNLSLLKRSGKSIFYHQLVRDNKGYFERIDPSTDETAKTIDYGKFDLQFCKKKYLIGSIHNIMNVKTLVEII